MWQTEWIRKPSLCDKCDKCDSYAEPVKHGKWTVEEVPLWIVKGKVVSTSIVCVCSACGRNADTKTNYCPNCGADMRERRDRDGER